jgi:hypothetical protein
VSRMTERMVQVAAGLLTVVCVWFVVTRIALVIINQSLVIGQMQKSLQDCQAIVTHGQTPAPVK